MRTTAHTAASFVAMTRPIAPKPDRQAAAGSANAGNGSLRDVRLSRSEQNTLALLAAGHSNRIIAEKLDLSQSSVATRLRSALHKLELERTVDYVLDGVDRSAAESRLAEAHRLTDIEATILRALLHGDSNADIAGQRGTADRTVANQVRAVFHKLGVRSRRQLWALAAREPSPRRRSDCARR